MMRLELSVRMIVLIVALVILVISGTFYLVYTFTAIGDMPGPQSGKAEAAGSPGPIYDVGTFTVNLNMGPTLVPRFLRVGIALEVDREETIEELKARDPQVRDAIITLLRGKSEVDVAPENHAVIKQELVERINSFLAEGKVLRSYFTDFVIQ